MIDIHHHLLPGFDDGSPSMEISVQMAEMAAKDGITHIVCTPHSSDRYPYSRERSQARLDQLASRLNGIVTLGLGCDFHMSYDNIQDALDHPGRYSINGRKYLLIEFADTNIPESTNDNLYELTVSKQRPIITHPERNPVLQRHPERLAAFLRDGALVQVTASSLAGRFGRTAQSSAEQYLRKNWVHFIATDAHNLDSRAPLMSPAHAYLKKHFGTETADRLCIENPRAVFEGKDLPEQPDALELYEHYAEEQQVQYGRRKRGFFSRVFGLE